MLTLLTGTLDPESVKQKITSKTKVIFHNHFCGYPGYIDEINSVGQDYGIPVVDDAIEAFGSEYKGKKIGNTGTDVTIFSFQAVRLPTTIDGGAIIFKDKTLYEKVCKSGIRESIEGIFVIIWEKLTPITIFLCQGLVQQ